MNNQISVIVVDDHHLFRSGIVALLNNMSTISEVKEASDGEEALEVLEEKQVDLVILDLQMPGLNGLTTCKQIKKTYPAISVLVLSWHCDKEQVELLLDAGAKGFLAKDCTKAELQTALNAVAQGGSYFSHPITALIFGIKAKNEDLFTKKETGQPLTEREQEILACIANEYTNKEIASQLFISQRTVETHRRNLIQKLQVKNTVGLVKYYLQTFSFPDQSIRIST